MAKSCWINPCHNLDNPTLPGAEKLGDGAMEPKRMRQCLPINVVNHDKPNRPLLGMVSYWVCHIRLPNLQLRIFYSEQLDQLLVVLEPLDRFS